MVCDSMRWVGRSGSATQCQCTPRPLDRINVISRSSGHSLALFRARIPHSCASFSVLAKRFGSLRWNPHHGAAFVAAASGPHVRCWDTRSMEMTSTIRGAHGGAAVRCLDFNPNKQVGRCAKLLRSSFTRERAHTHAHTRAHARALLRVCLLAHSPCSNVLSRSTTC